MSALKEQPFETRKCETENRVWTYTERIANYEGNPWEAYWRQ